MVVQSSIGFYILRSVLVKKEHRGKSFPNAERLHFLGSGDALKSQSARPSSIQNAGILSRGPQHMVVQSSIGFYILRSVLVKKEHRGKSFPNAERLHFLGSGDALKSQSARPSSIQNAGIFSISSRVTSSSVRS